MARVKSEPDIITQEIQAQWETPPRRREQAPSRSTGRRPVPAKTLKPTLWSQIRFWAGWAAAVVVLLALGLGLLEFEQFLRHDSRFRLVSPVEIGEDSPSLQIEGATYASRRDISKLFERDFGRSLYSVPVVVRREELRQMDWVKDASVTRLWPNIVKVKITERQPVAFVALTGPDSLTETALIDREGTVLHLPEQAKFSLPVITGLKRTDRADLRSEKVQRAAQLLKEAGKLSDKVSEVDVSELNNLKATVQIGQRVVTLYAGNKHFQRRLENFLDNYDEIHKSRPDATKFDVRSETRIIAVAE